QAATALKRAPALSATGETADDAGAGRDRPARGAEAGDPESCSASLRGRRGPVISRRACSPPSWRWPAACGRRTGPCRTQLRMLRRHPCGDVRDVAYGQFTAAE
ncbi:hypothetical protein, partial [Streptomyces rhizosphaericola]|uniref:hypothetical protein n=1 Tax=Streptomyces rhizosphaericola TaxID=2564098 RepID=UPI0019D0951F